MNLADEVHAHAIATLRALPSTRLSAVMGALPDALALQVAAVAAGRPAAVEEPAAPDVPSTGAAAISTDDLAAIVRAAVRDELRAAPPDASLVDLARRAAEAEREAEGHRLAAEVLLGEHHDLEARARAAEGEVLRSAIREGRLLAALWLAREKTVDERYSTAVTLAQAERAVESLGRGLSGAMKRVREPEGTIVGATPDGGHPAGKPAAEPAPASSAAVEGRDRASRVAEEACVAPAVAAGEVSFTPSPFSDLLHRAFEQPGVDGVWEMREIRGADAVLHPLFGEGEPRVVPADGLLVEGGPWREVVLYRPPSTTALPVAPAVAPAVGRPPPPVTKPRLARRPRERVAPPLPPAPPPIVLKPVAAPSTPTLPESVVRKPPIVQPPPVVTAKAAPAPSAPVPMAVKGPAKSLPVVPFTARPPVPVSELREGLDRFECKPLTGIITVNTCIARRERGFGAREGASFTQGGLSALQFKGCAKCSLGAEVEAATGIKARREAKSDGGS